MDNKTIFNFKSDISNVPLPKKLNNPFGSHIPEIVKIAAKEFQDFIVLDSQEWEDNLRIKKGKMFGVLVVQKEDMSHGYLGALSGNLPRNIVKLQRLIPSIFNDSVDDFFINKGMTALTEIGNKIKNANSISEINELTKDRKLKSINLQQRLFKHYKFSNIIGSSKNVIQIFKQSSHGNPPSAAGECSAPKLLQYAIMHRLKPIALAEFWWGKTPLSKERVHKEFYPACKDKCRPILEFILNDFELFNQAIAQKEI